MMRYAPVLLVAAVLSGCTAWRGGPESGLVAPEPLTQMDAAGKALVECAEQSCIEKETSARILLIDTHYNEFVSDLHSDSTHRGFITNFIALLSGIAGTLVDSSSAKTTYATIGTVVAGGNAIVDQELYFAQTVSALVAAMDANRAEARLRLRQMLATAKGMSRADDVHAGLVAYERAGSFLGAVTYIQATSREAQKESEQAIREIAFITPVQLDHKKCITNALVAELAADAAQFIAVANDAGVPIDDSMRGDANELRLRLRAFNRETTNGDQIERLYNALKKHGIVTGCEPPAN